MNTDRIHRSAEKSPGSIWISAVFLLLFSFWSRIYVRMSLHVDVTSLQSVWIPPIGLSHLSWSWHFGSVLVGLFCRLALSLDLPELLLMVTLVSCILQEQHRSDVFVLSVQHVRGYMISICVNTGDMNFDHLSKVTSATLFYYKLTFPFVANKRLWEDALRLCSCAVLPCTISHYF